MGNRGKNGVKRCRITSYSGPEARPRGLSGQRAPLSRCRTTTCSFWGFPHFRYWRKRPTRFRRSAERNMVSRTHAHVRTRIRAPAYAPAIIRLFSCTLARFMLLCKICASSASRTRAHAHARTYAQAHTRRRGMVSRTRTCARTHTRTYAHTHAHTRARAREGGGG